MGKYKYRLNMYLYRLATRSEYLTLQLICKLIELLALHLINNNYLYSFIFFILEIKQ